MSLIFDIETAPDLTDKGYVAWKSAQLVNKVLKDPAKIEIDRMDKINDKFGLSPMTGKIVTVGFLSEAKVETQSMDNVIVGTESLYSKMVTLEDHTEEELLKKTWSIINDYFDEGHRLVTYNGFSFDVPFLWRRSMLKHVSKPRLLPAMDEFNNKYKFKYHLDLFQVLNAYGEYTSLTDWAYLIGASNELSREGGKVTEWYQTGNWSDIKAHCLADIVRTYILHQYVTTWISEPGL